MRAGVLQRCVDHGVERAGASAGGARSRSLRPAGSAPCRWMGGGAGDRFVAVRHQVLVEVPRVDVRFEQRCREPRRRDAALLERAGVPRVTLAGRRRRVPTFSARSILRIGSAGQKRVVLLPLARGGPTVAATGSAPIRCQAALSYVR